LKIIRQQAEAGGGGGYIENDEGCYSVNGSAGTSYGNGGAGGTRGTAYSWSDADDTFAAFSAAPTAGSNGWVYIEYGGDI